MYEVGTARDPDWLSCRLDVGGRSEALSEFLSAACGSGFIDWNTNWSAEAEGWAAFLRYHGAPSLEHAERRARRLRDKLWWRYEQARAAAERDPYRVPLDLNRLLPVPARVRRKGYDPSGRAWCWRSWGTPSPLRKVEFAMELRRRKGLLASHVAAFTFMSEDWAPWSAVRSCQRQWPSLDFRLLVVDEDAVATRESTDMIDRRAA